MKDFPREKIDQIKSAVDQALKKTETRPIAAFDADGTLWSCDMGEGLFKYQIKNKLLPRLPENAWEYYLKFHNSSPAEAFLWLAQINQNLDLEIVRQWAKDCVMQWPEIPVFQPVREIIDYLHDRQVETYVVTASVKWAVEPAAALYGIPNERVIGISTKVINGKVSDEQDGPITWREGKVNGLLSATQGQRPFFCAGNTTGDLPLLESSTDLRLVIASAEEGHANYDTEREMIRLAQERNWFFHSFV